MRLTLLLLYTGMALVTYLPRMLPLVLLSRIGLPLWLRRWLSYVPVAVLAALLLPSITMVDGRLFLVPSNKFLIVSLPTFLVAARTRSLVLTVSFGIITMFLFKVWFPG